MSRVEARPIFESTSAAGAMLASLLGGPVLVGPMLARSCTSTDTGVPAVFVSGSTRAAQQTTSGLSLAPVEMAAAAVGDLRRLSGLTWEQLARLFGVSRRSLHFWASGKSIAPANEEHLQRVLTVLRATDRGSAAANRAALLAVGDDGLIAFDLLANAQYDAAIAMLRQGPGVTRAVSPLLSEQAKASRAPLPPEDLAGALHDRVHRETGAARAAKSVRTRSGR